MASDSRRLAVRRIEIEGFKAYKRFSATFAENALIVGPNNAGKSTLIAAIRTAARMLRETQRRRPEELFRHDGAEHLGFAFTAARFGLVDENLRYEFEQRTVKIKMTFAAGGTLTAVWPIDDDGEEETPFFYAADKEGRRVRSAADAKRTFPTIAVIPMLSPPNATRAFCSERRFSH